MTAEVLRRAAALMRERAEAGSPGRWIPEPVDGDVWGPSNRERICVTSSFNYAADAEHIASWHPAVALAVANWLDSAWSMGDQAGEPIYDAALTVARAYLGDDA